MRCVLHCLVCEVFARICNRNRELLYCVRGCTNPDSGVRSSEFAKSVALVSEMCGHIVTASIWMLKARMKIGASCGRQMGWQCTRNVAAAWERERERERAHGIACETLRLRGNLYEIPSLLDCLFCCYSHTCVMMMCFGHAVSSLYRIRCEMVIALFEVLYWTFRLFQTLIVSTSFSFTVSNCVLMRTDAMKQELFFVFFSLLLCFSIFLRRFTSCSPFHNLSLPLLFFLA
jgi:hypothetical protein